MKRSVPLTGLSTLALLMAMGPMNVTPRQRPSHLTADDDPDSAWAVLNSGNPDDRNIRQIDMALGEIKDEFDGILRIPRSKRSAKQQNRMEELADRATKLKYERGQLEDRPGLTGRDIDNALRGDSTPTGWTDDAGRRVRVLNSAQPLAGHRSGGGGHDPDIADGRGSPGNLIRGMLTGNWSNAEREREIYNLSTSSGAGVMIPETIGRQIIDLARAGSSVIAAGAQTVDMTAPKMTLTRVTGDPTVAGVAENAEIAESDPGIDGIVFQAKKQAVLVRVSRELLYDSPNAGSMVEQVLRAAMGAHIDKVALDGDGVGANPLGLLGIAGVGEVAVGGVPSWDDWIDGVQLIEQANGAAGATVMSPAVKGLLAKLKDGQGRYLTPPAALNDVTRYSTTKIADASAVVGDFTKLLIGVWRDVEIAISGFAKDTFEKDQVMFRVIWRGDVAATQPAHLTKLTGIALS